MRAAIVSIVFASAALAQVKVGSTNFRRQAFTPGETEGSGDNCVDAFGAGYVECRPETDDQDRLCINPSIGESCCENLWGCPSGSFCLVEDLCCPTGEDPNTCAVQNTVTLPAGFSPSTAPALASGTGTGGGQAAATATTTSTTSTSTSGYNYGSNYTSSPKASSSLTPASTNAAGRVLSGAASALVAVIGFVGMLL